MRKTLGSHGAVVALAASLALTSLAPIAGTAQEYAPVPPADAAAWGDSSGYNAVEMTRAAASALVIASAPDSGDASGYDVLEANRVLAARQALLSGDIGSMQEEALADLIIDADAAAMAWGDESGYNALETNRAAISVLIAMD